MPFIMPQQGVPDPPEVVGGQTVQIFPEAHVPGDAPDIRLGHNALLN